MGFVPKRVHSPSDFELIDTEHARKKYISEQFASAMAALSLDHGMKHGDNATTAATAAAALQLPPEEKQKKMAVNLIRANINGSLLPLEQRLGDDKLRIPEFILRPPPLTAYANKWHSHLISLTCCLLQKTERTMCDIRLDIQLSNGEWLPPLKNTRSFKAKTKTTKRSGPNPLRWILIEATWLLAWLHK